MYHQLSKNYLFRWILASAYFLFTLKILTIPGNNLPKWEWFDAVYGDKCVHVGIFGLLVGVWVAPFFTPNINTNKLKTISGIVTVLAIVYGVAIEFVQLYWIPNRSFDNWDIVADSLGAITVFLFINHNRHIKNWLR